MKRSRRASFVLIVGLAALLFVVLVPFYWIFTSSIKIPQEIIARTPTLIPQSFSLQHYDKLMNSSQFPVYLRNSTMVALATMGVTLLLCTPAAYALYRMRLPGRRTLFRIILITYAFPGILLLIPLYSMMSSLRLIDTLYALVIVNVTFAAPFAVWLLQAFFQTIPPEIEESAALDGANRLQILLHIIIPLTAPGLASVAIFAFITSWTEYMFSSVLIISEQYRTVPVGLAGIVGQYQVDWGLLLAGASVTTLPVLVLFALVGRYFISGLTAGAVKS